MTRAQADPAYDADDGEQDELDYEETEYEEAEPKRSPWAIASMICGLIALTAFGRVFGIISVLAVVFGHIAWHDIKRGAAGGKQLAIAGLGFGYLSLVISFIINLSEN